MLQDHHNLDIAMRTSALCLDPFRRTVFGIVTEAFVHVDNVSVVSECLVKWLAARNLKLSAKTISSFSSNITAEVHSSVLITHSQKQAFCTTAVLFQICSFSLLTTINLSNANWLTDCILKQILSNIPAGQLLVLDVAGCEKLSDESICQVAQLCSNLQVINIAKIRTLSPNAIWSLTVLTTLTSVNFQSSVQVICGSGSIIDDAISFIVCNNWLREINTLHCGGSKYSHCLLNIFEDFPDKCGRIVKLVLVDSSVVKVKDNDIQFVCASCVLLEELTLHHLCHLSLDAITTVGKCLKRLRILSCPGLENSDLVARLLIEIFSTYYSVDFCEMRIDGVIRESFQEPSANLADRIRLRYQNRRDRVTYADWTEKSMEGFGRAMCTYCCSKLISMVIGWWPADHDIVGKMMDLAAACICLKELSVVRSNVKDQGLVKFSVGCSHLLRLLRLSNCKAVGDTGVIAIVNANHGTLIGVDIDACHPDLSDSCLESVKKCKDLREFRIHRQQRITKNGVFGVKRVSPHLQLFDIYGCENCSCYLQKLCKCYGSN